MFIFCTDVIQRIMQNTVDRQKPAVKLSINILFFRPSKYPKEVERIIIIA